MDTPSLEAVIYAKSRRDFDTLLGGGRVSDGAGDTIRI